MKLYEDDEQMRAWDFIGNKKIDIIEEESNSDKEFWYICPKCQKRYKEKASQWTIKQCGKCREDKSELFEFLSGKWKRKYYIREILHYCIMFVFSFISSAVTVKLETFDTQFIYMTICHTVFLFGAYMLMQKYFQSKLLKNPLYQRYCITTFSLLKQGDVFALNEEVNLSLAGFVKPYVSDNYSNEDIVYEIKTGNKYFGKYSNNKQEVKYWKRRIQNDAYYNQVISDFETKSIINFKLESKMLNTALEFLITFIGILLSVVNYIKNWERFGWKSLTVFVVLAILFFAIISPVNKIQEKIKVNEVRLRLIVISSAIAKSYKSQGETQTGVNNV